MTGEELKRELQRAGRGHIETAASEFHVNPATLRRMIAGEIPVPDEIAAKAKALPDSPKRQPPV